MGVVINLLGPFQLLIGGQAVPDESWSRRDAASLVKLLALSRGGQLHREQVMDSLWGDLRVLEAAPRLHKAAHFARRAIGRADAVVLRGETVFLFPGEAVTVDSNQFESAARAALADDSAQAAAAVLDAYPDEALPGDLYAEWAAGPRERLTGLRLRLCRQARRWRELIDQDPVDEEAHLELMLDLARAGNRAGALRQFESLNRALQRELGTSPGPEATALRDEITNDLRDLGRITPAEQGRLEQQIRFTRTGDGVTLAFACSGSGPPLVKAANWLTHLDHYWHSTVWRHWLMDLPPRTSSDPVRRARLRTVGLGHQATHLRQLGARPGGCR